MIVQWQCVLLFCMYVVWNILDMYSMFFYTTYNNKLVVQILYFPDTVYKYFRKKKQFGIYRYRDTHVDLLLNWQLRKFLHQLEMSLCKVSCNVIINATQREPMNMK